MAGSRSRGGVIGILSLHLSVLLYSVLSSFLDGLLYDLPG